MLSIASSCVVGGDGGITEVYVRERDSSESCGVSYSESLALREIKVLQILALTCTQINKFISD